MSKPSKWLEIKNTAGKPTEILIYGEIGDYWDGLDATSLAGQIKGASGDKIVVRLNTPGGSVFTAQAFYSLLRASGKTVEIFIDGICASAGTIISSAGDVVNMPENAMFMIHNPMTSLYGANADEMRETADILDKVQETIIAAYRNKTGQTDEKLKELMSTDTYLTAQEAKDLGFIDNIVAPFAVAASLNKGILSVNGVEMSAERFKNIPKNSFNIVESNTNKDSGDFMNLAELKAQKPDLYAEAVAEGKQSIDVANIQAEAIKAERERITAINDAAGAAHADLAGEAIENGWDAGKFAIAALKADREKGATHVTRTAADAADLNNIQANEPAPKTGTDFENALEKAFLGSK